MHTLKAIALPSSAPANLAYVALFKGMLQLN